MSTSPFRDSDKASQEFSETVNTPSNVNAKIQNPLHGIPHNELLEQVETFAKEYDMMDILPSLQKGALLAQNSARIDEIKELDDDDREVIRREKTHKWSQPRALYFTVVLCSLAAAVQGWDQAVSNGANLTFPQEFNIDFSNGGPNASSNQWIVGLINSAPYVSSCLIGCWFSDPINNLYGRRGTIFGAAIVCIVTVIGSALVQTWPQLLICRLLLGLGMGIKASTVPIYAAENTPASIRGGLVMSWQLWTAFGIFLGLSANLALYQVGTISWRLQLGSAFIPAVPLAIGVYMCPGKLCLLTWLMKKMRYKKAYASFKRLRNSELQAARDLYYIHRQLEVERAVGKGSTYITRFVELFTIPRIRRATLASFVVMIAQQMCGINIITFYSSTIFTDANYSIRSALFASFGFGLVNWLFAFPAVWTIDTFGRRNLLLFTFPNMAWTLLAAGFSSLITKQRTEVAFMSLFVFLFGAFYSPGEGPVPFAYSAEVFPLTHREMGMAFAVATNLFWASVLSLTFPRILGAFGSLGAFGFYAGLNVIAFLMIFFLLPETKQRTLEELDYVFAVPTSKHISYQAKVFLPYFIKKWIFFQRSTTLKPLYDFEEVDSITEFEKGASH